MRERVALVLGLGMGMGIAGLAVGAAGCKKEVDRSGFISAINKSYAGHHECVWADTFKLPARVDISKDEKTAAYNALAHAGMLIREPETGKGGSQQMVKFSLSDKGHAAWRADPDKTDFGNFCFGHFNVTAVDSATPDDAANPTRYAVKYQYEVEGIPDWARTPESMRTFPKIAADTSIQSATTTLVKGDDGGWVVKAPGS